MKELTPIPPLDHLYEQYGPMLYESICRIVTNPEQISRIWVGSWLQISKDHLQYSQHQSPFCIMLRTALRHCREQAGVTPQQVREAFGTGTLA